MSILLAQAKTIIEASIAKGRDLDLKPLSVVVLDVLGLLETAGIAAE